MPETNRDPALERLLDERAITNVILRLARGTDRRDEALIRSCYRPDAFDDHGGFQGSGADFASWAVATLAMFEATLHFIGTPRIEVDDGGRSARAETACVAHHVFPASDPGGPRDSVMGLRYLDRLERGEDRGWRIRERLCAYDFTYIVPITEAWPLEPPFVRGRPDREDPSYRE